MRVLVHTSVREHRGTPSRRLHGGQVGRTYLIGTEGERDNLSVLQLMGRAPTISTVLSTGSGHDLRCAIDPTELCKELGWGPKHTDFTAGLRATIDWYRENESWWGPLKAAVEARYEQCGQ